MIASGLLLVFIHLMNMKYLFKDYLVSSTRGSGVCNITLLERKTIFINIVVVFISVENFLKKEIVSLQEYRSAGICTRKGTCVQNCAIPENIQTHRKEG